ncbi:20529_t:CDS:2 [Funneliformis geosporum]|uniref:16593_t:CDS:1 n=1 Tax=Funneliformis geosporum TaxID=1117311 RepID=A0A9W4WVC4_9GLOM|nr:20529_t:CDS:2 [Funneliformis geosporum]CAI2174883.1 16593_t:CDS:2 [Funneliformis geosporum]
MKITHCIFDMDGLLLDTERIYTEVSNEILSRFGMTFGWDIKSKMMGLRQREAVALLIKETGISLTIDEYVEESIVRQKEKFPFTKPMPGVMRLVKHLKEHNIPIIVATSSHRKAFEFKSMNNQELFKLFDGIVCGDDPEIKHGKPAPDIFLTARERLGNPSLEQCLVFEDALNGIQAAKNAGMPVIWIPDPNLAALYPGVNGATEVLLSLELFDPAKYGLPPYNNNDNI